MTAPFEVDFSTLPLALRYKLLAALVVPRPIALVEIEAAGFTILPGAGVPVRVSPKRQVLWSAATIRPWSICMHARASSTPSDCV
jgi:hypothetical protein